MDTTISGGTGVRNFRLIFTSTHPQQDIPACWITAVVQENREHPLGERLVFSQPFPGLRSQEPTHQPLILKNNRVIYFNYWHGDGAFGGDTGHFVWGTSGDTLLDPFGSLPENTTTAAFLSLQFKRRRWRHTLSCSDIDNVPCCNALK